MDDAPFPMSLCHACRFVRYNGNKRGSIFIACDEPSLPRYQPQPIKTCAKFAAKEPA
ncbi:MAG TPA: hypothetical protein VL463_26335 [Kofleriaceae bacterium]|nr:hypothetical protein [Kofleriaceae bacterium]